jgi:hypothetical protein
MHRMNLKRDPNVRMVNIIMYIQVKDVLAKFLHVTVYSVLIKYWNTSVRNKFFGARFIVHFTLHVSAPIGGHLQVVY